MSKKVLCFMFFALLSGELATGQTQSIVRFMDFETFPNGELHRDVRTEIVDAQFAPWGLVFERGISDRGAKVVDLNGSGKKAHSPNWVLASADYGEEFVDTLLTLKFRARQKRVQFYAIGACGRPDRDTSPAGDIRGTLTAYDAAGNVLQVDGPRVLSSAQYALMSISRDQSDIDRVVFEEQQAGAKCREIIDDLTIEGAPPPVADPDPIVEIESPVAGGGSFYSSPLVLSGKVRGLHLLSQGDFTMTLLDTERNQPYAVQHRGVSLSRVSDDVFSFSTVVSENNLVIGRYRIDFVSKNSSGKIGTASVEFSNFPTPVTDAVGRLGDFKFGRATGNCVVAFFERGALGMRTAGEFSKALAPFDIPTAIADKWRTINTPMLGPSGNLGCPIANVEKPTDVAATGWQIQNFERGRIYVPPNRPALFMPGILRSALEQLVKHASQAVNTYHEFRVMGKPLADPDSSLDVDDPTWIFQRFSGQYEGDYQWANTMEVRGRSPQLHIERIGGDPDEFRQAMDSHTRDENTPTHWETYKCSGSPWPTQCDFSHELSVIDVPIEESRVSGGRECNFHTWPLSPQWVTVGGDRNDFNRVSYMGIIKKFDEGGPAPGSHLASGDAFYAHEHCNATSSVREAADVLALGSCFAGFFIACAAVAYEAADYWVNGKNCRSDWNLHTRPLPRPQDWSLLANNNVQGATYCIANTAFCSADFEIEWEAKWAEGFMKRFLPWVGDMVYIRGRHIADCGHDNFNAEIHPPDTIVVMRNYVAPTIRVAEGFVWVNDLFDSSQTFTVFAPPRTSAQARLVVTMNEQGYFKSKGLKVKAEIVPEGVRFSFTALTEAAVRSNSHGQWYYPASSETVTFTSPRPQGPGTETVSIVRSVVAKEYQDYIRLYWESPKDPIALPSRPLKAVSCSAGVRSPDGTVCKCNIHAETLSDGSCRECLAGQIYDKNAGRCVSCPTGMTPRPTQEVCEAPPDDQCNTTERVLWRDGSCVRNGADACACILDAACGQSCGSSGGTERKEGVERRCIVSACPASTPGGGGTEPQPDNPQRSCGEGERLSCLDSGRCWTAPCECRSPVSDHGCE